MGDILKKIGVYAICKNEKQFIKRFYDSVKEADYILIGDTGSTDGTLEELKKYPIDVKELHIDPWRFDKARNALLDLMPEDIDICISIDLDEVMDENFKEKILNAWKDDTTRLSYPYIWRIREDGVPLVSFYINKIHARHGYKWTHPVHEVLTPLDTEVITPCEELLVKHYPDDTKPRSSYLPLLELSVEEDPNDDRNMHYLGREYMYYEKWDECIATLIRHLNLKSATWKDERCASMRFISRAYLALGRPMEARMWLELAIKEAPHTREPWVEMAFLEYNEKNFPKVIDNLKETEKIKEKNPHYINEQFCWDGTIEDLMSIAYSRLGDFEKALYYIDEAIKKNPDEARLQENKKWMEEQIKSNSNDNTNL